MAGARRRPRRGGRRRHRLGDLASALILARCRRLPRVARQASPVAHIVYSDGLVTVSVFVEPASGVRPLGLLQQGGVNVFVRDADGYVVTVLGEAPATTIRQIANSVSRR
jgi:negative regulator of sigma E activity